MANTENTNSSEDYLKTSMTVAELKEELDQFEVDLRDAEFKATLDIVAGVRDAFSSTMQVFQDIIERLEEKSPDPENDELITKLYNVYNALEDMRNKCEYL